ncbi:MAG: S8 family serine peptidase [Pseudomonadota bacterium]
MKKVGSPVLALSALLVACSMSALRVTPTPQSSEKYSKELLQSMKQTPSENQKAWVYLTDKPDSPAGDRDVSYLERLDQPVHDLYLVELERQGAKIREKSRWLNAVSIEASPEVLSTLGALSFVSRVEKVRSIKAQPTPTQRSVDSPESEEPAPTSETAYGPAYQQVATLGIPELHRIGLSGRGLTICLLDVGFFKGHEAFRKVKLLAERDFVFKDDDVSQDPNNRNDYDDDHGTSVWSIIGGYAPGHIIGPAYGATYLLAKTEDVKHENRTEEDNWVAALEWAASRGAKIVSSSLGYMKFDDETMNHPYSSLDGQTIVTAIAANAAAQLGILVVNAVGNTGQNRTTGELVPRSLSSPADAFGVLAVGAVDEYGNIAPFSSRGPTADGRIKPDVMAQGKNVYGAISAGTDTYQTGEGTSFAAPLVAGAAALIWQAHPDWTVERLKEALRNTASMAILPNNDAGYGVVNVVRALEYGQASPYLASNGW